MLCVFVFFVLFWLDESMLEALTSFLNDKVCTNVRACVRACVRVPTLVFPMNHNDGVQVLSS